MMASIFVLGVHVQEIRFDFQGRQDVANALEQNPMCLQPNFMSWLRKQTKWLKPTKSGWKPLPESQEQN
jgi:hypothetical protein